MKKLLFLLLALNALLGCKISDDNTNPVNIYDFQVNVNVVNPQPKYLVGDTLWMEISIPNKTTVE